MSHYRKINACLLAFFTMWACLFFAMQEYETALAMVPMWYLSRATMLFADVLYTFVTERPLFAADRSYANEMSRLETSRLKRPANKKNGIISAN